jgi:hypothetical protein
VPSKFIDPYGGAAEDSDEDKLHLDQVDGDDENEDEDKRTANND